MGAIALFTGVMVASALMGVLAKMALVEVPAFTFAWLQILAGGFFLTLHALVVRRDAVVPSLAGIEWAAVALVGLTNYGLVRILMMMALERLPVTTYTFLLSFVGLVTMLMSILFLAERPGRLQVVGGSMAVFGVWLFFPTIPPPQELTGVFYVLLVVLGLATSNSLTRWLMSRSHDRISSVQLSTLALWIGGLPIVVAGLWLDWRPPIGGLQNAMIILANGVIGIALVQTVFNSLLRLLHSYEASILGGSGLIWTALLAIPILGERLAWPQVAAITVMFVGLFLAQMRREKPTTMDDAERSSEAHLPRS